MRLVLIFLLLVAGCGEVWNDPYPPEDRDKNILYRAFLDRPKHLDPVQSYAEDEATFLGQIYEPPLQYHYLKRPYELVPLTAREVPKPYPVEGGKFTVYEVRIQPGIRYQPHPAFVPENHALEKRRIEKLKTPYELALGTRELDADDYIYQIKRLAHPRLHSPLGGLMAQHIVGLKEYAAQLKKADSREGWLDLRQYPLAGVERVDAQTYRIKIYSSYPQFVYWLAMSFFAPVPWEAEKFFSQPGMAAKNFTLDWWPVGTGPYMLVENNPNARMVLERNPHFRGEPYPSEGEPADAAAGLLKDARKTMPFIDRVVFSREKEGIPYWNKFLQGYYDRSGIGSDQFDQAVRIAIGGEANVTPEMERRGIRLNTAVATDIDYLAFNWLDRTVGGSSERVRKLRQAIAIAIDVEEYLSIFANGRGLVAHGLVPPGIFGWREGAQGINPVTHVWRNGAAERRPIAEAKKLLADAGYPEGRDAKTGQPLVLYLDSPTAGPGGKSFVDWYRKQFEKLAIQLEVRETDWNRFQEKLRNGSHQMALLAWRADYPDPENFLFLLYGPQSRVKSQGENHANYVNPEFDALFERMKNMDNSPERQRLVDRMTDIVRRDTPWALGSHSKSFALSHSWFSNNKPNNMARNLIKYFRVDPVKRAALRREWNRPVVWPVGLALLALVVSAVPAVVIYRRRERMAARPA